MATTDTPTPAGRSRVLAFTSIAVAPWACGWLPDPWGVGIAVVWIALAAALLIGCLGTNAMSPVVDDVFGSTMRRVTLIIATSSAIGLLGSYSWIYWHTAQHSYACFNTGALSRPSAIYFATSTLTTAGFGDIHPKSGPCQLLVSSQMILDAVLVVIVAAVLIGRLVSTPPTTNDD